MQLKGMLLVAVVLTAVSSFLPAAAVAGEGSLDPSFGAGGAATTSLGTADTQANGVVVQPDGKVVVATWSHGSADDMAVARYQRNGALDPAFGAGGVAVVHVPGSVSSRANAVALQGDGRLVAVGQVNNGPGASVMGVVRLTAAGEADPTFSGDGIATIDFLHGYAVANAVALQSDGTVVVAGAADPTGGGVSDFAAARLTPAGQPDATFGGTGTVVTEFNGADEVRGIALLPGNALVVAGKTHGAGDDVAIVRYLVSGSPDTGFSGDGKATISVGSNEDEAAAVRSRPDGSFVVVGRTNDGTHASVLVADFDSAGLPNTGFDGDGIRTIAIGSGDDLAMAAAIDATGRLLVAGTTASATGTAVAVLRLRTDGSLDTDFSGDGIEVTASTAGAETAAGIDLQPGGGAIVAGSAVRGGTTGILLRRYAAIPPPSGIAPPTVTGVPGVSAVLTCTPGTWNGSPTLAVGWLRNGQPITPMGATTYTPTTADIATTISCRVTATNIAGAVTADSNGLLVVGTAAPGGAAPPLRPLLPDLCSNLFGAQGLVPRGFVRAANTCTGTRLHDTLVGTDGLDVINAFAGDDIVFGNAGADRLYGGAGSDHVDGGAGNDKLDGGSGDDTIIGGAGTDRLIGGDGRDAIDAYDHVGGDVVLCGRGYDSVHADRADKVAPDCEHRRYTK